MKALLCTAFGPVEALTVQDIPAPVPGDGELRISVKAAALNYPDALMVQGLYQVKPQLPYVPGMEFAGIVTEIGANVAGFQVGDRVSAYLRTGGLAEEAVADARYVLPLPADMDFETGAALVVTYGTAIRGLKNRAHIQPGETLLVLGAAGGVGLAAIETGKALGAKVIAAASTAEKLELCRQLGADEVIDYSSESLKQRISEITDKKGVDVVFDPVGGDFSEEALRVTAWGGRYLVIGFAAGNIPRLPANLALLKERSIMGVYWGDSIQHAPREHHDNLAQLIRWFQAGLIRPYISERVSLEGASAAMASLTRRQATGKIIVLPGS